MTRVLVSTVVRGAPLSDGGRLLLLDLAERRVIRSVPIYPSNPDIKDAGRRGNARGGRGIVRIDGDRFVVADYHTLRVVRGDLTEEARVSTPRMVGLHELIHVNGTLVATSTTADRVLKIDLETQQEVGCYDIRTLSPLMDRLGLPASPPRSSVRDERVTLVANDLSADRSHLHVNAVAVHRGRLLCLLNRFGALVDLEDEIIVAQDESLRGGHNVVPYLDELLVNSSRTGRLIRVSPTGVCTSISLHRDPRLARFMRPKLMWYHALSLAGRVFPRAAPASRPLFLRGLAVEGARAYLGTSPAGVIEVDLLSDSVLNWWFFSSNVRECVHGLCIAD